MGFWYPVIALLLACSSAQASAAPELRPFTASYTITKGRSQVGTAELSLQRLADGRWSYQQHMQAKGFMVRGFMALFSSTPADLSSRSVFQIQDGRVIPHQFIADDLTGSNNDQSLEFDWKRGRVTGIFERKPVDLPTQPGLLDSQSVQVALMVELMAGRTPQRFVLAEKGRIRDYLYSTERTEVLNTAVGEHNTVVYRSSRPGSDKSTLFWCAPELGYLPLKVERRDGKSVEFTLTVNTLELGGTAAH